MPHKCMTCLSIELGSSASKHSSHKFYHLLQSCGGMAVINSAHHPRRITVSGLGNPLPAEPRHGAAHERRVMPYRANCYAGTVTAEISRDEIYTPIMLGPKLDKRFVGKADGYLTCTKS